MDDQNNPLGDEVQDHAPEQLARDLKRLYGANPLVPAEVDEAILSRAKRRLARKPARMVWRWAGVAAAAVLLAVGLHMFSESDERTPQPTLDAFAREDIDRDGRVDILDAFTLARRIESSVEPEAAGDINQDGRVDQKDVDAIAQRAVRLNRGAL